MDKYAKVERLLSNYKMLKISIENMEQQIRYLKEEDGLKGIGFDNISTSPTNVTSDPTANIALSNTERIHYFEHRIEQNKKDIEAIDNVMEMLEESEKVILTERDINSKPWFRITPLVCYEERQCRNIRTKAIKKLVVGIYGE